MQIVWFKRDLRSSDHAPLNEAALGEYPVLPIYVFEPDVIDFIPQDTEYDIGSQLFPDILDKGLPFHAISFPFNWIDIGQLSDYWEANQLLMRGSFKDVHMPGKEVLPGIWTGLNINIDFDFLRFNELIPEPIITGAIIN